MDLDRPLNQQDLAAQFQSLVTEEELLIDTRTGWLDTGWHTSAESVRDAGISVSVILPGDEQICRNNYGEVIKHSIPMIFNKKYGMENWRELKGNLIAPEGLIDYDEDTGATWR